LNDSKNFVFTGFEKTSELNPNFFIFADQMFGFAQGANMTYMGSKKSLDSHYTKFLVMQNPKQIWAGSNCKYCTNSKRANLIQRETDEEVYVHPFTLVNEAHSDTCIYSPLTELID